MIITRLRSPNGTTYWVPIEQHPADWFERTDYAAAVVEQGVEHSAAVRVPQHAEVIEEHYSITHDVPA
jgi:hypothetical protein